MQSKSKSHLEVITNQVVGVIIGWVVVYFVFPYLDYPQEIKATISSLIFFVMSYIRSYSIRRIFNEKN